MTPEERAEAKRLGLVLEAEAPQHAQKFDIAPAQLPPGVQGASDIAPDSAFRTAYAQPGDTLPNEQTWEREGVRAEQIGRTVLQQGADALASSTAMFGGGASQDSDSPAETEQLQHARDTGQDELVASMESSRRNAASAELDAEAQPRAARVGASIGQIPAYVAAGRVVGDALPNAPRGTSFLPRVGRVGLAGARGALENAAVQVPQGEDPSYALAIGTAFGAVPSAVIETGGALIGEGAQTLRPHAAEASARNSGARIEDLPQIRRRLGSVEEYSDALRRLRASGRIPSDATPEQARAVADQILGQAPGRAQPIMRAETQGAVQANPVVAERAASPDLAEQDQAARLTDLINQHHDQVAASGRVTPHDELGPRPLRRGVVVEPPRARPEPSAGTPPPRAGARRAAYAGADTQPPLQPGARANPIGHTPFPGGPTIPPAGPSDPGFQRAVQTYVRSAPGARAGMERLASEGETIDSEGIFRARREARDLENAQLVAPRPSDMSPLTRALERRGGDIDEAAREAINSLVEGRSGLTEQPLREYQASDELRRIGERNAGRGGPIPHVIPEQNLMSTRGIVGRAASRGINHVVGSDFVNNLLERVVKRRAEIPRPLVEGARHALSTVLSAWHESGDRRGRAEHHRQVETDPHYRALTRRKSSE